MRRWLSVILVAVAAFVAIPVADATAGKYHHAFRNPGDTGMSVSRASHVFKRAIHRDFKTPNGILIFCGDRGESRAHCEFLFSPFCGAGKVHATARYLIANYFVTREGCQYF